MNIHERYPRESFILKGCQDLSSYLSMTKYYESTLIRTVFFLTVAIYEQRMYKYCTIDYYTQLS